LGFKTEVVQAAFTKFLVSTEILRLMIDRPDSDYEQMKDMVLLGGKRSDQAKAVLGKPNQCQVPTVAELAASACDDIMTQTPGTGPLPGVIKPAAGIAQVLFSRFESAALELRAALDESEQVGLTPMPDLNDRIARIARHSVPDETKGKNLTTLAVMLGKAIVLNRSVFRAPTPTVNQYPDWT